MHHLIEYLLESIEKRVPEEEVIPHLKKLLQSEPDLKSDTVPQDNRAIKIAIQVGYSRVVFFLLEKIAEKKDHLYVSTCKGIALIEACKAGQTRIAQLLLMDGADPNFEYPQNNTPLSTAVYYARVDIVKLLLEHGASVDRIEPSGQTILGASLVFTHIRSRMKLSSGTKTGTPFDSGNPALIHALHSEISPEMLKIQLPCEIVASFRSITFGDSVEIIKILAAKVSDIRDTISHLRKIFRPPSNLVTAFVSWYTLYKSKLPSEKSQPAKCKVTFESLMQELSLGETAQQPSAEAHTPTEQFPLLEELRVLGNTSQLQTLLSELNPEETTLLQLDMPSSSVQPFQPEETLPSEKQLLP